MENENKKLFEIIIKKDGEVVVNEQTNCILASFRKCEQSSKSIAFIENATTNEVAYVIAGVKRQIGDIYKKTPALKDAVSLLELLQRLKEGGEE